MITIYHQKRVEDQHLWDPCDPEPAPWPERYEKVATVDTDDLDRAWELTNTIDHPWTSNEDVQAEPGPHRSSMVGDVFEHKGTLHLVVAAGFKALPIPHVDSTNAISAALRTSVREGYPVHPVGWSTDDIITTFGGTIQPLLSAEGERIIRGEQGWEIHIRF